MVKEEIRELEEKARKNRLLSLEGIYNARSGHPGGSLSIAEMVTYLYFCEMRVDPEHPDMPGRDRLVLSKAEEVNPEKSNASIAKTICTAFFVTWLNPQAIIDGTLMLGAFRSSLSAEEAIPFMAGAAAASFSWFTGLSAVVSLFSSRFRSGTVRMINIISGSIMLFYGVSLMRSFFSLLGTNLL